MGKAIGIAVCVVGVITLFVPWIFAYLREWLAIRQGRDRSLEHRDLDWADWSWMIMRCGLCGASLIAIGMTIFSRH